MKEKIPDGTVGTINFMDIFLPCNKCGKTAEHCICGMEFNPETNEWTYTPLTNSQE